MRPKAALVSLSFAAARTRAFGAAVSVLERRNPDRALLHVLTYHRVDEASGRPDLYPGLIGATPAEFAEQMSFLARRYSVIGADELLAARDGTAPLPERALLVTFDDAYADFGEHAWPVLSRLRLPAILFVPTAFPDDPTRAFWWDRVYHAVTATGSPVVDTPAGRISLRRPEDRVLAFRRLRDHLKSLPPVDCETAVDELCATLAVAPARGAVLGWNALRQLAADGVTLAPHTRTHPLLDRVAPDVARQEIAGSIADLEREVGPSSPIFAYPSGRSSEAAAALLPELGIRVAFTTGRGSNDLARADWLRLRRINVGPRSSLGLLRAQLLPAVAGRTVR
jgi:peptidoglycan/xylan/chitin deacetylase (PgdA/CDA1 family)